MAVESFNTGTLIIPMDEAYQDNGMFLAYGLVYKLLSNLIPVKWTIQPGKAYDGTDFTASASDLQTSTPVVNHSYSGGPFIISSTNAAAALPIIQSWQSANPNTKVHQATASFTAPIAFTLRRAPRISIEDSNSSIITGYLNAAKIPDSLGNTWSSSSPGVLNDTEITAGALFGYDLTNPCKRIGYDIYYSPHASGTWSDSFRSAQLDLFLKIGGMLHATCRSIGAIENESPNGPYITASGIPNFDNKGTAGTFTVDVPDYPSAQAVSTSGKQQSLPGGSEQTWGHAAVTYLPSSQVLAHFLQSGLQYDFMASGTYKGGTGSGIIVYEGGHSYSTSVPYSNNAEAPYLRFLLDSQFYSVGKPLIDLVTIPTNISTSPSTVTYALLNTGGSDATNATVTITLPNFATYNSNATITPTTVTNNLDGTTTLFWNTAALTGSTSGGTILTFTALVDPTVSGVQSVASFNANWNGQFGQSFATNYCVSANAVPGPLPVVTKTPLVQSIFPNQNVTWTITVKNSGDATLQSVVVTDTLPIGLTYVSATPVPSTVTGGGVNPTILTWQSPQIPATLAIGASFTITLTAKTPGHTTAVYVNQVDVSGKDGGGNTVSASTTAKVNVTNRPPTVTLISPNGGELICSNTTITWNASDPDGDSLTYALFYSSDGGINFTSIVSGLTSTSYLWTTTSLPSGTNYVVKVVATDGELSGEAVSASPFSIDNTPPTISFVSPTNGSILSTTPYPLQALATDNISIQNVQFLYSVDGVTFVSIGTVTTSVANVYSINWELDGLPNGPYKLRAIALDQCNKSAQTTIDVTLAIPPTVQLLFPNGGEVICPSSTTISWTASSSNNNLLTYTLQYSSNGGGTYTTIATGLTTTSYLWNTSSLPSGNNYLIKVIATDGFATSEDTSNGPFTIDNTPPTLSILSPTNGQLLSTTPFTLQATATDNVGVQSVEFLYSSDGITYISIGTSTTPVSNVYSVNWTLTSVLGGPYKLKAIALDGCNNSTEKIIDVIVALPPIVKLISPNGREIICPTGTTISWTASDPNNDSLTYTLQYSSNGGGTYTTIATGLTTTSYLWNTSALPSGNNYLIKVIATDGFVSSEDTSDGPFTIDNTPPTLSILSPTNGQLLSTTPFTLQATATDNVGVQSIEFLYSSDGVTYVSIGTSITPVSNVYSVNWTLTSVSGGPYKLKAIALDGCNNSTEKIIDVIVSLPPVVKLISPNGGEIICSSGTTISWTASSPSFDPLTYTLQYSSNGGGTYTTIVTGLTTTSYLWNTASLPSGNNYLIKVIATNGYTSSADTSNGPFTIDNTPPTLLITAPPPNSYVSGIVIVSADATDNVHVSSVSFSYSNDGGATFVPIATVTTPLGISYVTNWDTTLLLDGTYIIRAVAADQCNYTTTKEITVLIDKTPPTVVIISPPDGSTVDGVVTLFVEGQDNQCLKKVELYIDGVLVETVDGNGQKLVDFGFDWDTNQYSEGPHNVTAIATDCAGLTATDESTYIIDNLPDCYKQILINGNLVIPDAKPDIETILDFSVKPTVDKIVAISTIDGNKFLVSGFVTVGVTYVADVPTQNEHFAHFNLPFAATALCPNLSTTAKLEPVILIEHVQWHIMDKRTIKKYIVLFVGLREIKD